MEAARKLIVRLEYGDMKAEYEGAPDEVFKGVVDFVKKLHPSVELLSKFTLSVDLRKLIEEIEEVVAIQPSGPVILSGADMTIEQAISLLLAGAYAGNQVKLIDKDSLTLDSLMKLTGKTEGALTGTLSRMKDKQVVEKLQEGGYRITLLGIKYVLENVVPNLKSKRG